MMPVAEQTSSNILIMHKNNTIRDNNLRKKRGRMHNHFFQKNEILFKIVYVALLKTKYSNKLYVIDIITKPSAKEF